MAFILWSKLSILIEVFSTFLSGDIKDICISQFLNKMIGISNGIYILILHYSLPDQRGIYVNAPQS